MREDGPNAAAAGANIGAYVMSKVLKPQHDKISAENIVEIPLTVNGYKGENGVKKVMYMEKGLGITFTDANGKETTYTIGQDGKIYDSNNHVVSTVTMDASQYAVLDVMSKEAREATKKKDGSDVNDNYDVLTSQDIREAEDKFHPFNSSTSERTNNQGEKNRVAGKMKGTIRSVEGKKIIAYSDGELDIENGHKNDVDSKGGTFTVKLVEDYTVKGQGGHKYNPTAGSVSIFMKK